MSPPPWLPDSLARVLANTAQGRAIWLVGGAVRDALLQRKTLDFDFAVADRARLMARKVADALGANYYDLDVQRDAGRVVLDEAKGFGRTLDFAALKGGNIEADLRARDFTINALAVQLDNPDRLIDPCGGLQDLKDEALRACGPDSVERDPIRALRAVRIAADLKFRIEGQTQRQVAKCGQALKNVSAERVRDEMMRMLSDPRPVQTIRVLDHLGLLSAVFPELEELKGLSQPGPDARDAWEHTLSVIDRLGSLLAVLGPQHDPCSASELALAEAALRLGRFRQALSRHLALPLGYQRVARSLLFFAAMYHEVGRPQGSAQSEPAGSDAFTHSEAGARAVEERARDLRLNNAEVKRVGQIVRHHLWPDRLESLHEITARDVYRFFRSTGAAGIDVVLLSLGDLLGGHEAQPPPEAWAARVAMARELLEAYFEDRERRLRPPPLLKGDQVVKALGAKPGPQLGRVLELVREAQAAGEVKNRRQALALARQLFEAEDDLGKDC